MMPQPDYDNAEGRRVGTQELEIRILTGDHKDEIMSLTNYMSALFNVDLEKGDNIIVRIMTDEDGAYYASVFNYDRGIVVGAFVLIFFVLLAILGGKKGIGALIGLLFTLSCIWFILIPAIITGLPVIPVTVIVIGVTSAGAAAPAQRSFEENFLRCAGVFHWSAYGRDHRRPCGGHNADQRI